MKKFRYKTEEEIREFSKVGKVVKSIPVNFRKNRKAIPGKIKSSDKIKNKINELCWGMKFNPKDTTKEALALAAENPGGVASQLLAGPVAMGAGAAIAGTPGALAMAPFPHSAYWIAGEQALKKRSPGYARVTKKMGNAVRKSKNVDALVGKSPEVNYQNAGPNAPLKEKLKYNLRSGVSDISNGIQTLGKGAYRFLQRMSSEAESQKSYTIQEGHYTGPKDMEKIPGTIEVLGKATLGGTGLGALAGGIAKETGISENTGILDGAKKGGKIGFLSGIVVKVLLNHLHKPMSKIKYQEVDKKLRKEFGMYRVSGFTFGDTREKRKTYDEKFGTNDRDVLSYPINICINNNQVTMYTLNLSDSDLEKLNSSLDYYCKKYSGMEYSSRVINSRNNTYSVCITFTNYEAISSFIMEISESLGCRINLLNNDVLPESRIGKGEIHDKEEERIYSNIPHLSKYDLAQMFSNQGAARSIRALAMMAPAVSFPTFLQETLNIALENVLKRLGEKELVRLVGGYRKDFDNDFLLYELKRLGYIEGSHYTVGFNKSELNLSMVCGKVIITSRTGSKSDLLLPKILKSIDYKKTDFNGKANLWTFLIKDKGSFDIFLKSLIGTLKPNIYDGTNV